MNSTVQGAKITIEHSEAQYSLSSGVLLQVDGRLTMPNEVCTRFAPWSSTAFGSGSLLKAAFHLLLATSCKVPQPHYIFISSSLLIENVVELLKLFLEQLISSVYYGQQYQAFSVICHRFRTTAMSCSNKLLRDYLHNLVVLIMCYCCCSVGC